jgi:uncharacterized protein involved in exopolysaccharide biosynthesis
MALLSGLHATLPDDGQFLTITLSGSDPNRTAKTLNAWVDQFVTTSGDLQKRHLLEFKEMLGNQLAVAEGQLRGAESELGRFRESTITLPSGGSIGAAAQGPDAVVSDYFQERSTLSEIQSERVGLEQLVADAKGGPVNPQAFLAFPAILNNAPQLRAAIDELSSRQAALRSERQFLTDANPRIKQLSATVHTSCNS